MKDKLPGLVEHLLESIKKDSSIDFSVDEETKVTYMPEEYMISFFEELVKVRGVDSARQFIEREGTMAEAFPWALSAKGHQYWQDVEHAIKANYRSEHGTSKKKSKITDTTPLDVMIKEAEDRGFGEGVSTKFGIIRSKKNPTSDPIDHELCSNGDFFYYNIKVFKNGKWIKPNQKIKKSYEDAGELSDAIHERMHELIERLTKQK